MRINSWIFGREGRGGGGGKALAIPQKTCDIGAMLIDLVLRVNISCLVGWHYHII